MKFFDYTKLSFSALVKKIGSSRYFDLPAMLEEVLNRLSGRVEILENAPSGGIESLSGDFVDNTDPINPILDRGYKVYTALLTQSGTDVPVATVLENTLGGDVVWSYEDIGVYRATLTGAFTENKTGIFFNMNENFDVVSQTVLSSALRIDANFIEISTVANSNLDLINNVIQENFFEIRVYN